MLSLAELRRAAAILADDLDGARLDKIVQPDDTSLVLSFKLPSGGRRHVLLSVRPGSARLSCLADKPKAPRTPPRFAQALRAKLGRARGMGARIVGNDRQVALALRTGDGDFELLLSILGPRSNVYLLDGEGLVVDFLRPLAKTRRNLKRGEPWSDPESGAPGEGEDRFAGERDADFFTALELHYGDREDAERGADIARRLSAVFDKEDGVLGRKLAALRRDLEAAHGAEEDRHRGELLKTALDRVRKGASEVEVSDHARGETLTIPLDPKLTPQENLARIFKRYRKRARAVEHLGTRIADLESERRDHQALRDELRTLLERDPSPDEIDAFAARPSPKALLARHAKAAPALAPDEPRQKDPFPGVPARLHPRRYRSSDGLEIWVGRSDEANDLLSTRLARGRDLFLHLEGSPGSHVVLRTGGRKDPPAESLLEAAELAVHFSRHKAVTRADVHVVPIANVRKPRGAKPGLVMVTGGKSLDLRRDPERLERILKARIEE